jgi:hypothetical protein
MNVWIDRDDLGLVIETLRYAAKMLPLEVSTYGMSVNDIVLANKQALRNTMIARDLEEQL